MPNNVGSATTTTLFTPILPGREEDLQACLLRIPSGDDGPFRRLGTTHFARFVVIDRLELEAPDQKPDVLKSHYLLFNGLFDGPLDAFINGMLDHFPEKVDEIWGHCVAYPGAAQRDAVHRYFRHNELEATFFFPAYGQATLPVVQRVLALRDQFTRFAVRSQGLPAAELQAQFRKEFRP